MKDYGETILMKNNEQYKKGDNTPSEILDKVSIDLFIKFVIFYLDIIKNTILRQI